MKYWLFIKTYLPEYIRLLADMEKMNTIGSLEELINAKIVFSFLDKYHVVKMQELKEKLGAVVLVWLKYINLIETLYQLQFLVYTNNFPWNWWFGKMLWNKKSPLRSLRYIQLDESHRG